MRRYVHPHVQVAGRSAALARSALSLELDALAVADSGRDARLDGAAAHRPAAARADRAGVIDNQSPAPALPAGLREREVAEVPARLARALAGRAHSGDGAGLGAGAHARLAGSLPGQPQRHGGAVSRITEAQRRFGFHVSAAAGPLLLRVRAVAEHAAQQVSEPAAGPARRVPLPKSERASSYSLRRFSSDSTLYASEISLKRSSDFESPLLASGWYLRASLRYDFLISSALASLETARPL